MKITYKYNNVDLKTYGVSVAKGRGFIGKPERKEPKKYEFPDEHGYIPDLAVPVFKERTITLDCYIIGSSATDLVTKFNTFSTAMLGVTDLVAFTVAIDSTTVFTGNVYTSGISELSKTFDEGKNVGTFTLTIIEPNPTI